MTVVTINSSQALMNAVQFAVDGDIIKLAPGTYSGIILRNASFANGITITSADPNAPATITDLTVNGSDGLTFSNLNLTNTGNINIAFRFSGSTNLTLDNLNVSGVAGSAAAMNAQLMLIRDSSHVQLTNSEFSNGWHGVSILNTDFATVQNNYFHDLRTDGVRGGGNSDYTIRGNVFTSFHPAPGDHADAIQLWTTQTTQSASNIIIEANVVMRGNGSPIQGILMGDVSGVLPFKNVLVAQNVVAGGMFNGIAVHSVINGYIADNVVQAFADQSSGLQGSNLNNVVITANQATKFFGGLYGLQGQQGNTLLPIATDGGDGAINQWLAQHSGFVSAWSAIDPAVLSALNWNGSTPAPSGSTGGSGSYVPPPPAPAPAPAPDQVDATPSAPVNSSPDVPSTQGAHVVGGGGADVIDGSAAMDLISGHAGNDILRGGGGNDRLLGNSGDDTLMGESGDDNIRGDDGNDALDGGAGQDLLDGGRGSDVLTGGADGDLFRFRTFETDLAGKDVITDFQRGLDRILITDGDYAPAAPGEFRFIGVQSFKGSAGEVRYTDGAAGVTVHTDVNGDGAADFEFTLKGVHSLSVSDFIL